MNSFQKIIKYGAIAFGAYLSFVIIGCIIFAITTIFGITMGIEYWQENNITQEAIINSSIQEYEDIENLRIDINICKLTIQKGDKLKVETYNVSENMECQKEGNTLIIKDSRMHVSWFDNRNLIPEIIISIPNQIKLRKVEIKAGINDTQIQNLSCEKLEIETGVGKSDFREITATSAMIKGGAGRVTIQNLTTDSLDLEAGMGEVILTGEVTREADIDAGVGRLEVNLVGNKEQYQIKAKTGLGNFVVDNEKVRDNQTIGSGSRKVKIDAGIGEIAVKFITNKI